MIQVANIVLFQMCVIICMPLINLIFEKKKTILFYRKKSLARFYDMKHCVRFMSYDDSRKMMLTVGPDHIIKVWSLKGILWIYLIFDQTFP